MLHYGQKKNTMNNLLILFTLFFVAPLFGQNERGKEPSDFLPKGYTIDEKIKGDVNKDGLEDYVVVIKGSNKNKIIKDEYRGELDRNRRGIIVLLNKKDHYELVVKNYDCFSSENEDGGVYFPPELSVEINKGNLYLHYAHGRYGYWEYTFRFKNSDFELIGYDSSSNSGPIVNTETSINFLTKKKLTKENINESPEQESGEEIFKETWTNIKVDKVLKLSEIKDFDELNMSY
jgi:hypothetical protein